VAGFDRNGWPTSVGIGGQIASESVAALASDYAVRFCWSCDGKDVLRITSPVATSR
jgi:hypothetical protein